MALLAWLGLSVPANRVMVAPPPPPVEAFLVPPPPPRPRLPQDGRAPPQTVTFRPRLILPAAPSTVEPLPAPPAAAQAESPGPSAPPPVELPSNGLREALRRSVGCTTADLHRLTPAERAACESSFNRRVMTASPRLGMDPAKEAGFDQAAAAKARERRERQGPMANPMVPCQGWASNFGVGCNPNHQ